MSAGDPRPSRIDTALRSPGEVINQDQERLAVLVIDLVVAVNVAAAVAFTTGEIIEIKRRRCGSRDDPLGRVMEGTDSSIVPQY